MKHFYYSLFTRLLTFVICFAITFCLTSIFEEKARHVILEHFFIVVGYAGFDCGCGTAEGP
jgi:hypothetical protein